MDSIEQYAHYISSNLSTFLLVGGGLAFLFLGMFLIGLREFLSWYLRIHRLVDENKAIQNEIRQIRKILEHNPGAAATRVESLEVPPVVTSKTATFIINH